MKLTFPFSEVFTTRLTIVLTLVGFVAALLLKSYHIWLSLMVAHFVADFVLQSDYVATHKSKENDTLTFHAITYSLFMFFLFGPVFACLNGLLHFATDYYTSRLNSKLYTNNEIHWFFTGIGFDQLIHTTCLFLSAGLILY